MSRLFRAFLKSIKTTEPRGDSGWRTRRPTHDVQPSLRDRMLWMLTDGILWVNSTLMCACRQNHKFSAAWGEHEARLKIEPQTRGERWRSMLRHLSRTSNANFSDSYTVAPLRRRSHCAHVYLHPPTDLQKHGRLNSLVGSDASTLYGGCGKTSE